ncbi:Arm DNA-binding domain-containing protein [Pseudomonas marginalis]|uniref:Arm DNA-binding domain-containing protein n=1 Tax=Pseudomonas marginalis TaxID=298 RepID=UPI003B005AD0
MRSAPGKYTAPNLNKLPDERGLYLLIKPNSARYWRMKYCFAGKREEIIDWCIP